MSVEFMNTLHLNQNIIFALLGKALKITYGMNYPKHNTVCTYFQFASQLQPCECCLVIWGEEKDIWCSRIQLSSALDLDINRG